MIPHSSPFITENDKKAVSTVLDSNNVAHGQMTRQFEHNLAEYLRINNIYTATSGRRAIEIGLVTLGVKAGTEVIVPTYACSSIARAVVQLGAKPIFCDAGKQWVSTCKEIAPLINERTSAIIAVHTFGIPCEIEEIMQLGPPVLEDASQALGLKINNRLAGTIGDVGTYSFSATKCLTTGEGGAIISSKYTEQLHTAVEQHLDVGLSDILSGLGVSQLKNFPNMLRKREEIKCQYDEKFKELPGISISNEAIPALYRYTIRFHSRDFSHWQSQFKQYNIAVRKGVDSLAHRHFKEDDSGFPNAIDLLSSTLSLPYYPALQEQEITKIINTTIELFSQCPTK